MGRPKATLELPSGELLLDRVHRALLGADVPVTLIGEGKVTPGTADLERIGDVDGPPGPLGGLLAALDHDPTSAWLIAACDLPRLEVEAVRWLIDQRESSQIAVLPRLHPSRVEPLLAIYEPGARGALWELAQAGSPAPKRLAELTNVKVVQPPQEFLSSWTNINTPEELASLNARCQ